MSASDNNKTIFFHVGLPKTASTFMQRNVFPFFKGIKFVKKHDFKNRDRIISKTSHSTVLLSIELDLDSSSGYSKMMSVAERYPQTKPIIVFRRHGSWVGSKYKYYLRKHGTASFEEYFHPGKDSGVLKDKNLQFYQKIELLEEKYGQKPLVMFQEEFQKHPIDAIKILADYVGAEFNEKDIRIATVKKSYSEHSLFYVRKLNRWYKYDHSGIKNPTLRILYKKFSGGILHLTAYFRGWTEPSKEKAKKVLPKEAVIKINEEYATDWKRCIDYAAQTRKVYID
jgi:hypothetical protein